MQRGAETQLPEADLLRSSHRGPEGDEDEDRSPRPDGQNDAIDLPTRHPTERDRSRGGERYEDRRKEGDGGHAPAKCKAGRRSDGFASCARIHSFQKCRAEPLALRGMSASRGLRRRKGEASSGTRAAQPREWTLSPPRFLTPGGRSLP